MESQGLFNSNVPETEQIITKLKGIASEKILSLKLKDVSSFFFEDEFISGVNQKIEEKIKSLEESELVKMSEPDFNLENLIDNIIKTYIFDNISLYLFAGEENMFRLYMVVFDPYGNVYADMYKKIFEVDVWETGEGYDANDIKDEYMEYLVNQYNMNKEKFNVDISKFLR